MENSSPELIPEPSLLAPTLWCGGSRGTRLLLGNGLRLSADTARGLDAACEGRAEQSMARGVATATATEGCYSATAGITDTVLCLFVRET